VNQGASRGQGSKPCHSSYVNNDVPLWIHSAAERYDDHPSFSHFFTISESAHFSTLAQINANFSIKKYTSV